MKELMIISIHATHTGGDAHICAVNLALPAISIHATHTGGDMVCVYFFTLKV